MKDFKKIKIFTLFFIILLLLNTKVNRVIAQSNTEVTRILFLLDASGSMEGRWGGTNRIAIAKKVLSEIADSLRNKKNVEMALRVYGHQSTNPLGDCQDSKLEVGFGFGKNTAPLIKTKLNSIRPRGSTPIAYSIEKSAGDFPKDDKARNVIILITDGLESCGGDPCAISLLLQKKNIFLKPFIIGIGLGEEAKVAFECIGSYYNAETSEKFESVMQAIVNKILFQTKTQVNLLDKSNKPSETNANMTFYDAFSGVIRYQLYHTINHRGHSDTIGLDPVNDYHLTVHTIPAIEKYNISITENKFNKIDIPAGQGYLNISIQGATVFNNINNKIRCLIQNQNDHKTIHVQNMNTTEKYLIGKYDIEFLTLPRIKMKDIVIDQSKTTSIQIQPPGILMISRSYAGYGGIFLEENNQLKKIYELKEKANNETIALQPGNYRIVFRAKLAKKMNQTIEKTFQISSGSSVSIKL